MGNTQTRSKPRYEGLKVTREEYLSLEDDGFRYDMIGGVLHVSPSPTYDHGKTNARFSYLLLKFLDRFSIGEVTIEVDLFLPDGGDKLRPDLSFILKENLGIVKGHIHGTPDLICEVLSDRAWPTAIHGGPASQDLLSYETEKRDLGAKADRYLTNGVREYWIVDPRDTGRSLPSMAASGSGTSCPGTIRLWINRGGKWEQRSGERLASELLAGFVVAAADLFR